MFLFTNADKNDSLKHIFRTVYGSSLKWKALMSKELWCCWTLNCYSFIHARFSIGEGAVALEGLEIPHSCAHKCMLEALFRDAIRIKSSPKNKLLILKLLPVPPSSTRLWLYLIHVDYEEEWWQHTPLLESHTQYEWLWFESAHSDTNAWAGIQLLDGQ